MPQVEKSMLCGGIRKQRVAATFLDRIKIVIPDDMEVDNGFEVMFEACVDALVENRPVGFDRCAGTVPQFHFVDRQPNVVKADGGEPGGVLVIIFDWVAFADLTQPVADIDAADDGEAVGGGGAGEVAGYRLCVRGTGEYKNEAG